MTTIDMGLGTTVGHMPYCLIYELVSRDGQLDGTLTNLSASSHVDAGRVQ
jgi:hypothetical protein